MCFHKLYGFNLFYLSTPAVSQLQSFRKLGPNPLLRRLFFMHHSFVTKHESNLITGQCCMYCNHKNVIVDSLRMPGYIQSGRIVDQDQRGELKLHQSHFLARVGVVWWNICRCKMQGLPWERKDMEVPSKKHKAEESRKLVIEKIEFSSFHSLIQCKTCSRTSKSDSIEFYKFNVAKMNFKIPFQIFH